MKLPLTYGFGIAVASTVLALILFFLGYHNDPDKLTTAQMVGGFGGMALQIGGLILALRAARDQSPERGLSYGRGVGVGALVGVFAGLFGAILTVVYGMVINPGMSEVIYQAQVAQMEAKGATSDQIAQASGMLRFFTGPIWMAIANLIFTPIMCTVFALIIAAFLKRAPVESAPAVA